VVSPTLRPSGVSRSHEQSWPRSASRAAVNGGSRPMRFAHSSGPYPPTGGRSTQLAQLLADHRTRYPGGPADPVFPPPFDDYRTARRLFRSAALDAQLHDGGRNPSGAPKPNVTMHDLRHTFGVHCAQAGVPIVRLQKLLGHASPHMTMRYMKHAPESYFAEDAAKVAASLTGQRDRELSAQVDLSRQRLARA
jgi:hypothetical protein